MTKIGDILDTDQIAMMVDLGLIRSERHPELPLTIYCYTDRAVFEREWTPETLNCRGLIVDDDGRVIARPFPKFFNHNEPDADKIGMHEGVFIADKIDGSLGIIYPTPSGYAVATKGAFCSDQAQYATKQLNTLYPDFVPVFGMTYLVEIVYPANRVVVDYMAIDDLF